MSGVGNSTDKRAFERGLYRRFPVLDTIAVNYGPEWDDLTTTITEAWRQGKTEDEIADMVDDQVAALATKEIADARAALIGEVVAFWATMFETAARRDPSLCPFLAAGRTDTRARLPTHGLLVRERSELAEKLVGEHDDDPTELTPARLDAARNAFFAAARRDLPADVAALVTSPPQSGGDPHPLCTAWARTLRRAAAWDPEPRLALAWRFGL
jgi:hypothetical protein